MSSKALNLYWSHTKSIIKSNWKYAVAFAAGSFFSSIFSFVFAKKITGKNVASMIWWYMAAKQKQKYRNTIKYDGFSVKASPIRPSTALIAYDALFRSFKTQADPVLDYKTTPQQFRKEYRKHQKMNAQSRYSIRRLPPFVKDAEQVIIKETSVNNQGVLKGHLLSYPGSDINNGVIYYIHGGGFYMGYPEEAYQMLCIMMQYTGCKAFAIEYHLCPDISVPQQVDECIEGYKYILNKLNVDSKKIFISGASAGATLTLLTLQKLNKVSLPQPCGGIIISAACVDFTCKNLIKTEQEDGIVDAMFNVCPAFIDLCIDKEDRKEYENGDQDKILSLPKYSAMNGDWKGLCPLYVSASQNEVGINDNKLVVEKCKQFEVDVEYDWDPYLLHVTIVWAPVIPEARNKLIIVIEWMKKQLQKNK